MSKAGEPEMDMNDERGVEDSVPEKSRAGRHRSDQIQRDLKYRLLVYLERALDGPESVKALSMYVAIAGYSNVLHAQYTPE